MKGSLAQFLVPLAMAAALAQPAAADESPSPGDSINIGFGGMIRTMPHCDSNVYTAEYEHRYTPSTTLLGRGNLVDYTFNDMNYREHGILRGLDFGARYYPAGAMHGLFTGGALGYWNGDWTFSHFLGTPAQYLGTARSHSLRLNFELGDRIPIPGTRFSIMPEANAGKFFSSRSCAYTAPASMVGTPCSQKSEVNVYFFVGLALGVAF